MDRLSPQEINALRKFIDNAQGHDPLKKVLFIHDIGNLTSAIIKLADRAGYKKEDHVKP